MLTMKYVSRLYLCHWIKPVQFTKYCISQRPFILQCNGLTTKYYASKYSPFSTISVTEMDHTALNKRFKRFCAGYEFKKLCNEHNLNAILRFEVLASFRKYCLRTNDLPEELYTILKELSIRDISRANSEIIFSYFLKHYKEEFPHYFYDDKLKELCDLRNPADWYPKARTKKRKIIFHAGPTNSGKTYNAMQRFLGAKSGIYCSPLKLLANEIYQKSNSLSTPCDLLTGERRSFANADGSPSSHIACTIEMAPLDREFEVGIIDEIQFIRDAERGRAWLRAVIGLCANEIHLCGEAVVTDLITRICDTIGETVEVQTYKRFTSLSKEETALRTLDNVQPGDCIVCFRIKDIYDVSRELESRGIEVAILYGALPPEVKLAHAAKFNDPEDTCKVMVATDVIGTGLNLCIRRIIFYSMEKIGVNEFGETCCDILSVSSTLQIAGRAGRYGTQYEHGFVTTYRDEDMPILNHLLAQEPESIPRAGIAPQISQIAKYAEKLPNLAFSTVLEVFESHVTFNDDLYFICNMDDMKTTAELIDFIQLKISDRYTFCCTPMDINHKLKKRIFVQEFVEKFSKNEVIGTDWIKREFGYPFHIPETIDDMRLCEVLFELCNCYLWLSFRFPLHFTEADKIREYQSELNVVIRKGVNEIKKKFPEMI